MMEVLLTNAGQVLAEAGFSTAAIRNGDREGLAFENDTVLGFLFAYATPTDLLTNWRTDSDAAIGSHQFGLRRAGTKAWNAYVVLLASGEVDGSLSTRIAAIEEDLVGTRKIAVAGVSDAADIRAGIIPLLPIQSAPKIEAANIPEEIRLRTTQLPARTLEAFLSGADPSIVLQVMEE